MELKTHNAMIVLEFGVRNSKVNVNVYQLVLYGLYCFWEYFLRLHSYFFFF